MAKKRAHEELDQRVKKLEKTVLKFKSAEEALRDTNEKLVALFQSSPMAIITLDPDGIVTFWNPAAEKIFGWGEKEVIGRFLPIVTESKMSEHHALRHRVLSGEGFHNVEALRQKKDGSDIYISISTVPLKDSTGCINGIMSVIVDITERKRGEQALRESEGKLRAFFDSTPFPIGVADLQDDKIHFWSRSALALFGHPAPTNTVEWYQMAYPDPDYRREVTERWKSFLAVARESGQPVNTGEYRITCSDGSIRICELYATFLLDNLIVTFNDITKRKQLEKEIVGERDFLNKLISLCPDGIIGVNDQGKIIIFNQAAEKLTLHKADDVIDKMNVADIYESLEKARSVKKNIYSPEHGGQGRLQDFETEIVTREKNKIPIRLSATLIQKDGQELGNVGFFHDISDKKQFEARLRDLSIRDSLSGLFNHRHFHSVLAEELARTHRYKRPLSLICFDLDNFKQYNDNLGHLEGDNIIRLVGQYLKEIIRCTDKMFRYGGDEFMIMLTETAIAGAHTTAEKIRKHFNSCWPYETVCKKYDLKPVTLSIGVAEFNPEDGPETLIKRTDLAMYEAKRAGGDRTVAAEPKIGKTA